MPHVLRLSRRVSAIAFCVGLGVACSPTTIPPKPAVPLVLPEDRTRVFAWLRERPGDSDDPEVRHAFSEPAWIAAGKKLPHVFDVLAETLENASLEDGEWNGDASVREYQAAEAVRLLGTRGTPRFVSCLVRLTRAKSWRVRIGAAEALGQLGDHTAVAPLERLLRDTKEDNVVRAVAADALGWIGSPSSARLLRQIAAEDGDRWVAGAARTNLVMLDMQRGCADAIWATSLARSAEAPELERVLASSDGESATRANAALALGAKQSVSSSDLLRRAGRDPDPRVAAAAVCALSFIEVAEAALAWAVNGIGETNETPATLSRAGDDLHVRPQAVASRAMPRVFRFSRTSHRVSTIAVCLGLGVACSAAGIPPKHADPLVEPQDRARVFAWLREPGRLGRRGGSARLPRL